MLIDSTHLPDLASGAAFLGSGGGGDPYYGSLIAAAAIEKHGPVQLLGVAELEADALVVPCGWIGAPTVSMEKLPNGREAVDGLRRLERILGRRIDAVMPIEIGGSNGLAPLIAATELGLPIVDADGMGRAFPESQMAIFNIRGLSACPSVVTSASGAVVVLEALDNLAHESVARSVSVALGGIAHMVEYPISGIEVKKHAILGSVSAAIAIGAAVREARSLKRDPFAALAAALRKSNLYRECGLLIDGKITDVERETRQGFSVGRVRLQGFDGQGHLDIEFQNENLVARNGATILATVPDIISILDRETAETITTERLQYGQRVKVVAASAPDILRESDALKFIGPQAFGFGDGFTPVERLNGWTDAETLSR
jgi:DUF917 family protein